MGEALSRVEDIGIAGGFLGYLHSEKLTDFLSGQLLRQISILSKYTMWKCDNGISFNEELHIDLYLI
jgi:hypothetical protein